MPPRIVALNHVKPMDGAAAEYSNADVIDASRVIRVQKFAEKPKETKDFAKLSIIGCKTPLSLLSKYYFYLKH
jgi:hypothetical protein